MLHHSVQVYPCQLFVTHTQKKGCFFFFNEKVPTPLLGFVTSWELSDAVIQWDHQTRVEILVIK